MTITNLYAIHDAKAQRYTTPFQHPNDEAAMREFSDNAINPDYPFIKHPADYSLFRIGTYDDSLALATPEAPPQHLITALTAKESYDKHLLQQSIKEKANLKSLMEVETAHIADLNKQLQALDEAIIKRQEELSYLNKEETNEATR